jgi:GntR family transcriptional repressor for pyruvate dehydrogenase complex
MRQNTNISANIVKKILDMINAGTLKPGQKLPSERVLADFFSVSRVSVREALRTLDVMKTITIKPREGAFINEISTDNIFIQENLGRLLDHKALLELFEVRGFIEPIVAECAAARTTVKQSEKLLTMCGIMAEKVSSGELSREEYLKMDLNFHLELCKTTKNRVLYGLMSSMVNLMIEGLITTTLIEGYRQKGYEGHLAIATAVKEKDPVKARLAMHSHLQIAHTDLIRAVNLNKNLKKNAR